MMIKNIAKFALIGCLALGAAGMLSACGKGAVAATVNGQNIYEEDVTAEIMNIRTMNGAEDDVTWTSLLNMFGMTPEMLREEIINEKADQILIEQGIEEMGAQATDEQIDAAVADMRANFASDEAWLSALQSAGYEDEEAYEEEVAGGLGQQNLAYAVDPEGVLKVAQESAEEYGFNGAKRSSHILFAAENEAEAQKVLDQINSGELDFAEAAQTYSIDSGSAANGGDVGWDCMTTFVDEYQSALDDLDKGEVSVLVPSEFGIHIIMCTDVCTIDGEITDLNQLPAEFSLMVKQMATSQILATWLEGQREAAEIVINPMPEGLPYEVVADGVTDGDETAEAEAGTEGDAATEGQTEEAVEESAQQEEAA